jgi:hypothetical protein
MAGKVIYDNGVTLENRMILVGDYLDRYPESLINALATSNDGTVAKIRFWMQTHQTIDLDGVGKQVADYALAQGHITQDQHDAVLA